MNRYEITFDFELNNMRPVYSWSLYRGEGQEAIAVDFGRSNNFTEAMEDLGSAIDMDLEHAKR